MLFMTHAKNWWRWALLPLLNVFNEYLVEQSSASKSSSSQFHKMSLSTDAFLICSLHESFSAGTRSIDRRKTNELRSILGFLSAILVVFDANWCLVKEQLAIIGVFPDKGRVKRKHRTQREFMCIYFSILSHRHWPSWKVSVYGPAWWMKSMSFPRVLARVFLLSLPFTIILRSFSATEGVITKKHSSSRVVAPFGSILFSSIYFFLCFLFCCSSDSKRKSAWKKEEEEEGDGEEKAGKVCFFSLSSQVTTPAHTLAFELIWPVASFVLHRFHIAVTKKAKTTNGYTYWVESKSNGHQRDVIEWSTT